VKVLITQTFKRAAKKLHRNQVSVLETAIETIKNDPAIGELKKGDLAGVRVYKFHILKQLILLAYLYDDASQSETLTLLSFAPHENFYANLKSQLKA
jgi:mRNA-degrading endonuclease RelE of RelBE toxin-antitoxin system